MKKIKNIVVENGEGKVNLKSGKKIPVKTKTTYTYYTDGTNDCNVEILNPIDLLGKSEEVK